MLPKAVKWIMVHLLMLLYHFRMPIWVTALKASKEVKKIKAGQQGSKEETPPVAESVSLRREKLRARKYTRCSRREKMHF